MELHGRYVGHGSMHGIVCNHTDHMLPCMELHGSLMNLDPGFDWCHLLYEKHRSATMHVVFHFLETKQLIGLK